MRQLLNSIYEKHSYKLLLASGFLIPLKLILAYAAAIPLIILWIAHSWGSIREKALRSAQFAVPFLFFALSITASALYGIDPIRSLRGLPSLFFFSLMVLVVTDILRERNVLPLLGAVICGQSLASLHSVLEGAFGIPSLFLGKVTESGQLALTTMVAIGTAICISKSTRDRKISAGANELLVFSGGALNTILLTMLAFLPLLNFSNPASVFLCLAAFLSICGSVYIMRKPPSSANLLAVVLVPLLLAALLVNLKRGPWSGVIVGAFILLYIYEKRLLLPLLTAAVCSVIFLEPVQTRLKQSSRDFFIAGGRSIIWEIGGELAVRYPLGVGYKNSPFLKKYSPEIPPELTHFHNNLLNIVVENGWLTVMLFVWWIWRLVSAGFRLPKEDPYRPVAVGISCAFIAWQVAGIVEYNFGDSEVMLLAFVLIGVLNTLSLRSGSGAARNH